MKMRKKGNWGKSLNSDPGGRPVKPAAGGSGRSLNIHEELISGGKDPLVDAPISLSMKFTLKKVKSADFICISPTGGTWGLFHLERADCCRIEKRESLVKTGGRLRRFSAGISRFFLCVRRGNVATRRSGRKRKQKQISPPLPSAGKVSAQCNISLHLFAFNVVQVARLSPIWISPAVPRCRVHFT